MGLFTYTPPPSPVLQREDLAAAAAHLLDKKGQPRAGWVGRELEYLDKQLQPDEPVISLATMMISTDHQGIDGVVAFTGRRLFAVYGERDSKRRPVGRPTVQVFDFADLDHFSGGDKYIGTYWDTRLVMKDGEAYRLLIGPSVEHGRRFISPIQEALDQAKFQ